MFVLRRSARGRRPAAAATLMALAGATAAALAGVPGVGIAGSSDDATLELIVFVDFDRDGRIDPGERGRPETTGVEVRVDDGRGPRASALTGAGSAATITIDSGDVDDVRVRFDTPDGFTPTFVEPLAAGRLDAGPAVQFVTIPGPGPLQVAYGIVPESRCPDDPADVGAASADFPNGSPNSEFGKLFTTCFVDGSSTSTVGAQDVIVAFDYDDRGWTPQDPETGFGGNREVEHLAVKSQAGAVWGLAYDEWDGRLYASAVVKRHSGLGPEGIDGLYWLDVGEQNTALVPEVTSVSLDDLSPDGAPSFGDDPSSCPSTTIGFRRDDTRRGGRWDCRDLDAVDAGGDSFDIWAYDRVGREGIGDIDITPDGETLLVMNATADAVFIYDVTDGDAPAYVRHLPIDGGMCRGGRFEAWGLSARDGATAYVGITCTAAATGSVAALVSHVVELDLLDGAQQTAVSVPHDYPHGPGYTADAPPGSGRYRPWLEREAGDGPPTFPDVEEVSAIRFLDFLDAYGYSNDIEWHQPLLSDIEIDPVDESLVLGVMDRWSMMTGVFGCDIDPSTGCGHEFPAPPAGDYDGVAGNDPVAGYTSGFIGYVAGDLLRACNVASGGAPVELVLEGGDGCDPGAHSPVFGGDFGGGPAGMVEWYWNDQAFVDFDLESAHPEPAQGAVYNGDRRGDVVYTVMNPVETFGAGVSRDANVDGSHVGAFQLFRTDFANSDGTGWKSAGLGDVEGCSIPLEVASRIWFDSDNDGLQEPGEPGVVGAVVRLIDNEGVTVATAVSDRVGAFWFGTDDGVRPGRQYELRVDATEASAAGGFGVDELDEITVTERDAGDSAGDDAIDSDATISEVSRRLLVPFRVGEPGDNLHTLAIGLARGEDGDGKLRIVEIEGEIPRGERDPQRQGPPTLKTWLQVLGLLSAVALVGAVVLRILWGSPGRDQMP